MIYSMIDKVRADLVKLTVLAARDRPKIGGPHVRCLTADFTGVLAGSS